MSKIYFGPNIKVSNNTLSNFATGNIGKDLTHVYHFPSCVENATNAFYDCRNLVYFDNVLSDNLINMNGMFFNCGNLSINNIKLSNNVVNLVNAFKNTKVYGDINIPNTVKLMNSAFENSNIENIHFPIESWSELVAMSNTFRNCKNLQTIDGFFSTKTNCLHNTFTDSNIKNFSQSISQWTSQRTNVFINTFKNCKNLKEVNFNINTSTLQDSMQDIFYGCSNLKTFIGTINAGNKISNLFYGCSNLKSDITINNIKEVDNCFYNCSSVETINLSCNRSYDTPYINDCFINCVNIKNINIDIQKKQGFYYNSSKIGDSYFETHPNCVFNFCNLSSIYQDLNLRNNFDQKQKSGYYISDYSRLDFFNFDSFGNIIGLNNQMFNSLSSDNIIIPLYIRTDIYNSLSQKTTQLNAKFLDNPNYQNISFYSYVNSSSVKNAFENSYINEVYFLTTNSYIQNNAFRNSTIKKIYFKNSIVDICNDAFNNCINLEGLYGNYNNGDYDILRLGNVYNNAFSNCIKLSTIFGAKDKLYYLHNNCFYNSGVNDFYGGNHRPMTTLSGNYVNIFSKSMNYIEIEKYSRSISSVSINTVNATNIVNMNQYYSDNRVEKWILPNCIELYNNSFTGSNLKSIEFNKIVNIKEDFAFNLGSQEVVLYEGTNIVNSADVHKCIGNFNVQNNSNVNGCYFTNHSVFGNNCIIGRIGNYDDGIRHPEVNYTIGNNCQIQYMINGKIKIEGNYCDIKTIDPVSAWSWSTNIKFNSQTGVLKINYITYSPRYTPSNIFLYNKDNNIGNIDVIFNGHYAVGLQGVNILFYNWTDRLSNISTCSIDWEDGTNAQNVIFGPSKICDKDYPGSITSVYQFQNSNINTIMTNISNYFIIYHNAFYNSNVNNLYAGGVIYGEYGRFTRNVLSSCPVSIHIIDSNNYRTHNGYQRSASYSDKYTIFQTAYTVPSRIEQYIDR